MDGGTGVSRRLRGCAAAAALGMALTQAPLPAFAQDGGVVGQCTPPSVIPIKQKSWAQQRMAPERVWHLTKGRGIVVGVVDTGVSGKAPTLRGAVLPGISLLPGSAVKTGDGDCFGSGTFIAALIAARPDPDPHVPFAGLAPEATIFPVRVDDDPPKIQNHTALAEAIAVGIKEATDAGAKVIAVGLVATVGIPALRAAVDYAYDHDVLVVASAATPKPGQLAFPARLPGVVAVAPIGEDGPSNAALGAEPTLAAPAVNLIGVGPEGKGHRVASSPQLAVGYVAGVAALVRAHHPELPAEDVDQRLRISADHPSTALPHDSLGYGVVNPYAAVTIVPDRDPATAAPPDDVDLGIPPEEDPTPTHRALWWTGGVRAVALLVAGPTIAVAARERRAK